MPDYNSIHTGAEIDAAVTAVQGGTGAWVPIQTQTVAVPVTAIDFTETLDNTYKEYALIFNCETDVDTAIRMQYYDNGTLVTSSSYSFRRSQNTVNFSSTSLNNIFLVGVNSSTHRCTLHIDGDARRQAAGISSAREASGSGIINLNVFGGSLNNNYTPTDINGLRVFPVSGNITAGTFTLYGVKN